MNSDALRIFGELLMKEVRDRVLAEFKRTLDGQMKDADSATLSGLASLSPDCRKVAEIFVPYAVDTTLHYLLNFVENEDRAHLLFELPDGSVDLATVSDGLSGELYGSGWIKSFSQFPPSLLSG